MKRRNKKYFTLIELLFVIAILVILIGISWVAGTKVLRNQTIKKTKAEIFLLTDAIRQYKDRFDAYPPEANDKTLNFAAYLSKMQPGDNNWPNSIHCTE
ncbi:MAG: type II secretion system GspH family protein [Lentisphaeraceae bacterium]|nr:type II secretion system GspH family protein [Lentisphaeraceae bacterium]